MKSIKFHLHTINPIHRDLIIVMVTGMLISIALVTVAYTILAQL